MSSAAELRAFADNAERQADEYREAAETATEYWRDRWLKAADSRDEHAEFYRNQAWYAELHEAKSRKEAA